MGFFFIWVG